MEILPNNPQDWFEWIVILILGGFSLFQVFGGGILKVREQSDKADDRLIKLLKDTVEELERKVKDLDTKLNLTNADLVKYRTENDMMTKVLQGRDVASLEYQNKALDAMKKVDAVLSIVTENSTQVKSLCVLIERHLQALEA